MRELFNHLSIDQLASILYSIAVRLALRGLLTVIDVAVIRSVTDDPGELHHAA